MTEPNLEKGQVILVGAGPGDIGLLTLRGKDWLVRADVVIYAHLVNSNMLRFASSAELIYR
jgi:siroheme synthase